MSGRGSGRAVGDGWMWLDLGFGPIDCDFTPHSPSAQPPAGLMVEPSSLGPLQARRLGPEAGRLGAATRAALP